MNNKPTRPENPTKDTEGKRRPEAAGKPGSHRSGPRRDAARRDGPKRGGHGRDGGRRDGERRDGGGRDTSSARSDRYVYGLHAVEFALRNTARDISAIWATENAERKMADAITLRRVPVHRVLPRDLDKRLGSDAVHQGIALEASPPATIDLETLAEQAIETGLPIVVLDQVTDPHNVGAVLRSGAVFGIAGLITPHRHSAPLGGTLAKAASGALDLVPLCLVQNLAKSIAALRRQSLPVIGLDGGAEHQLLEDDLKARGRGAFVLALGSEGRGLRELTRQSCDALCRIGGDGPIASLNVSNAAAIALHLAAMQRRGT